ncbi:thioredoxin domain-containing protein [Schaalia sp. 19OD2882]|uniref:DsbA family protein n=1 Tax=Schaalia sp. 19OD2882 TaxID=2794089 RepID=UPI001C1EEF36|nr:thioredoxin domain-containing protein [Schaalia sp. 19OD2882]QWW19208.1 thioredoxin domain-containing protein [Schaalia sp. 19OD2882]
MSQDSFNLSHAPVTPTAPPPRSPARPGVPRPLVALLLVVIAVQALAIAWLATKDRPVTADTAPSSSQSAGTSSAEAPSSSGASRGTKAAGGDEYAPSFADPKALELIHSQQRRDPADGRAKGKADAPVVLVLWSDFACPWCTRIAQDVDPALKDLVDQGVLRVEWRDLAQITETSALAAQAGVAAAEQGKFWEFHDAVYAAAQPGAHPEYTIESLTEFARTAGVPDLEKFAATTTSQESVSAVSKAKSDAYALGITGTPFMFVGDAVISGYRDPEYVRRTVLEQAKTLGAK